MKKMVMALLATFILAACGDNEDAPKELSQEEAAKMIEEGTVGYEVVDGTYTEAENVSEEMEQQLLTAFNEYLTALNEKNLEKFKEILAVEAEGFSYEEEIKYVSNVFEQYDTISRVSKEAYVIKYIEGKEAHILSNMDVTMVEKETNNELKWQERTVMVFILEEGKWKLSSVHARQI